MCLIQRSPQRLRELFPFINVPFSTNDHKANKEIGKYGKHLKNKINFQN